MLHTYCLHGHQHPTKNDMFDAICESELTNYHQIFTVYNRVQSCWCTFYTFGQMSKDKCLPL
jgi:hypothetical protein